MIRSYAAADAAQLAALHNKTYDEAVLTPDGFRNLVADTLARGGFAWTLAESSLSGYAMIAPVAGLPGVGDLTGCIALERQRCGLGSELLGFVLEALQATDFWQIAHSISDVNSPAACFLRRHGFFVEHEEWVMELADLNQLPDVSYENEARLQGYARATAVSLFCRLYAESFSGLPWDQPFTRAEVVAMLVDANDMLFLTLNGEAIGFAWVSIDEQGKGLIEPLGIAPAYQKRGFGRLLLLSVIRELISRGAQRVEIGGWRSNEAAIHLYESVGFRQRKTLTYLAFNVK